MADTKRHYLDIISDKRKGLMPYLIRILLSLFSFLYLFIMNLREFLYKIKILKSKKLPCFVISIGNLTWGGTGKTPVTEKISKILSKNNISHAILSRGYKSENENQINIVADKNGIHLNPPFAADEALMLAENLKGIPIITCSNRYSSGKFAIEKYGVKALILDDGYQHIALERDLNILLIDSSKDFEKNRLTPRGTLREPFKAISRADIAMLTKTNQSINDTEPLLSFIKKYNHSVLIKKAVHRVDGIIEFKTKKVLSLNSFKGKRILAFSAIAAPQSFRLSLKDIGVDIAEFIEFEDHHYYSPDEVNKIHSKAEKLNAQAIITTEKDIARNRDIFSVLKELYFLKLSVDFEESDFENIILKRIKHQ